MTSAVAVVLDGACTVARELAAIFQASARLALGRKREIAAI